MANLPIVPKTSQAQAYFKSERYLTIRCPLCRMLVVVNNPVSPRAEFRHGSHATCSGPFWLALRAVQVSQLGDL